MDDGVRVCFIKEPTIEELQNELTKTVAEAKETERAYKKLTKILGVFLVIFVSLSFYMLGKVKEVKTQYDQLYYIYADIYDEFAFYNRNAVIVQPNVRYYHSYDCTNWDKSKGFYIYNEENAKNYRNACPVCQKEE